MGGCFEIVHEGQQMPLLPKVGFAAKAFRRGLLRPLTRTSFHKKDESHDNEVVYQMDECTPVVDIRACVNETGAFKLSMLA
jgi:hypothetical protein